VRQPIARLWLALPEADLPEREPLLTLLADELNVKVVELIGDESALTERRVKPLLPKIGKRLGTAIPAVMAAARGNEVEYLPDGSVRLGGVTLAPGEVEILATPRPGTAVAHDDGLVVAIDTTLTEGLRTEGDVRELQRAVQDLRREAGLALDETIELWIDLPSGSATRLAPYLAGIERETLATVARLGPPPKGAMTAAVDLDGGTVRIALRPTRAEGSR